MQISDDFKKQIVAELLARRNNFDGTDGDFSRQFGINRQVYSRLKGGEIEGLLTTSKWLNLARELDVQVGARKWQTVRTDVFQVIEEDVLFCKGHSKGRMFVDDCGIGKTYTARYLARTLKNCFYLDASQCKKENELIRALGKAIGVGDKGRLSDIRSNTKYYLRSLPNPVVIIDEVGDLNASAFLALKEYWNATEFVCGWYLMGADGLRAKMERGIEYKKIGYAEMFRRHSENYGKIVPASIDQKKAFYKKLITDVMRPNITEPDKEIAIGGKRMTKLDAVVYKCLTSDDSGRIGCLGRAESLAILYEE